MNEKLFVISTQLQLGVLGGAPPAPEHLTEVRC